MKRSRLEIIAEILQTAKDGKKKRRIMHECNLNYPRTKELLSHLLETRLLRAANSYHTTEKGPRFLRAYHKIELLLNTKN